MSVIAPSPQSETRRDSSSARPRLLGLGLAVPPLSVAQPEIGERLARLWDLQGSALDRWRRIISGSGIDRRSVFRPIEEIVDLSTAERMSLFEAEAPGLGVAACRAALERTGIDPSAVTDLVVVSCTGFSAPGLDIALVDALGLAPTVRRLQVGFMGCFGAITGLRAAAGACAADPTGVTLMVCVELCALHLRRDTSPQNLVATAIFGDGAAAAVVVGDRSSALRDAVAHRTLMPHGVGTGASMLLAGRRDRMTWRITDTGFAMTLARQVPELLRTTVGALLGRVDPSRQRIAVHPGGAAVLDAVDDGLGLGGAAGLASARAVLREYGNMSSPSVLFVLERILRCDPVLPVQLMAFGPGLTVETLDLLV